MVFIICAFRATNLMCPELSETYPYFTFGGTDCKKVWNMTRWILDSCKLLNWGPWIQSKNAKLLGGGVNVEASLSAKICQWDIVVSAPHVKQSATRGEAYDACLARWGLMVTHARTQVRACVCEYEYIFSVRHRKQDVCLA